MKRWVILIILFLSESTFSQDTTQIIFHFHGNDTTSKIGATVMGIGDVNSDGYDDIAITSDSPQGTYVFFGGNPVDSIPDMFLRGHHIISDPGDFTGDGIMDLLISDVSKNIIYLYQGYGDSIASIPGDSLYREDDVYSFGGIRVGSVSDDSIFDVLARDGNYPAGGKIYYYENPFTTDKIADWTFHPNDWFNPTGSQRYGFIDYNGDNNTDIYVGLRGGTTGSKGYIYFFYGPDFKDAADLIIELGNDTIGTATNGLDVYNLEDIDGDGWDDLGVVFNQTILFFNSGPFNNSAFDYKIQRSTEYMSFIEDVNGDGETDFALGGGISANGDVSIFLGGSKFDLTYDETLFREDLPPLFLDRIGWRLASAGDFNGDGYNDVIFGCQNFAFGEPHDVFILGGGPNIVTGVEYDYDQKLPDGYFLHQNYPNPFNPSTTISFEIPTKSDVNLSIYNVLGQKIRTLINKELSAGSYTLQWDGINKSGKQVSSGMYIYKLESEQVSLSKKMMLLK